MMDKTLFELPGMRGALALLGLGTLAKAACIVVMSLALGALLTGLWEGGALAGLMGLVVAFLAGFLGQQAVTAVEDARLSSWAQGQTARLRRSLLERVFDTRGRLVRDEGTAAVTSGALEGMDQIDNYLRTILPKMVEVVVVPLACLVAAACFDGLSAAILAVSFPVIIFFMILIGNEARDRAEAQFGVYQRMSNHFIDTLRGIDTLAAFGAAKSYEDTVWRVSERFRVATMGTLKVATLSGAVLDLIATLGVAAVAVMLGFRLVDGSVSLLTGLTCLVLAPEFYKPVRAFASDFHASLDGKTALAHVMALVAAPAPAAPAAQASPAPWGPGRTLALSHVSFTYPALSSDAGDAVAAATAAALRPGGRAPARPAGAGGSGLTDVTATLHGFERVSIVGASGAGKSTLVNLLAGFADPTGGVIALDGTPVATLCTEAWQRQVLYVPQDPYLFRASLADNIRFYTPDASDEDVAAAVAALGLDELVSSLPRGLDTVIGDAGRTLSGGQAQRIALARALLDPTRRVLVLDEPTAHLDIETERELKERMLPLFSDRLVVLATHRLHWLPDMDTVLVLENGALVEVGSYEELMGKGGALARFVGRVRGGDAA